MTSIDDNSDLDHAYFQALEETVVRIRGTPLLLSPADWQIAKQWRHKGIPLSLISRVLEELFSRPNPKRGQAAARSLRYCAAAIEEEWRLSSDLVASGAKASPPEFDLESRLEALAGSLPDWIPSQEVSCESILGLSGSARTVEAELEKLDDRLMSFVMKGLDPEELSPFEARAEESMLELKSRLPEEEFQKALDRLIRRMVRRTKQLPVLSLLAPEAIGGSSGSSD